MIRKEEQKLNREMMSIFNIIINALPVGSSYAAILLALAEAQKEIVFFWSQAEDEQTD
jgi:hypothetical protein